MSNFNFETMKQVKETIRKPYTFPGGYEKFAVCKDGGVLCVECLKSEYYNVCRSTLFGYGDGWEVSGIDAECNLAGSMTCDHCNHTLNA